MNKCFVIFLLSIFSQPLFAADWKYYFEDKAGYKYYIDQSSIMILKNGNKQLWEKLIDSKPNSAIVGVLTLYEIDCAERKYEKKSVHFIEPGTGNILRMDKLHIDDIGARYLMPNDLDEQRLKTWCGKF